jgi:hypothetical protein
MAGRRRGVGDTGSELNQTDRRGKPVIPGRRLFGRRCHIVYGRYHQGWDTARSYRATDSSRSYRSVLDDRLAGANNQLKSPIGHMRMTDHSFNATFLMTYRSFATGVEIVDHLTKRYRIQPPAGLTPDQVKDWQTRKQKPVKLR